MVKFNVFVLTISLFIFKIVDGACKPTSQDILGPYYVKNSRHFRKFCTSESMFDRSDRLVVRGRVVGEDCRPVKGTRIDVWQADPSGQYYVGDCRGYIYTNDNGYYQFTTIHPGKYAIDRLRHRFRPAHLHFKVFGGSRLNDLVTQMYFAGDSNLGRNDSCGVCNSNRQDLVVRPRVYCDDPDFPGCVEVALFNIVLSRRRRPHFRHRVFQKPGSSDRVLSSLSSSPSDENINGQRPGLDDVISRKTDISNPGTLNTGKRNNDTKLIKNKTSTKGDINVLKTKSRPNKTSKRDNHGLNSSTDNKPLSSSSATNNKNTLKNKIPPLNSKSVVTSTLDKSLATAVKHKSNAILDNKPTSISENTISSDKISNLVKPTTIPLENDMESAINRELDRILANSPGSNSGKSAFSIQENTLTTDNELKPVLEKKQKSTSDLSLTSNPNIKLKLRLDMVKAKSLDKKHESGLDNIITSAHEGIRTSTLKDSLSVPSSDNKFTTLNSMSNTSVGNTHIPSSKKSENAKHSSGGNNEQNSAQNNAKGTTTTMTTTEQIKIVKSIAEKKDKVSKVKVSLDDILNFLFDRKLQWLRRSKQRLDEQIL